MATPPSPLKESGGALVLKGQVKHPQAQSDYTTLLA